MISKNMKRNILTNNNMKAFFNRLKAVWFILSKRNFILIYGIKEIKINGKEGRRAGYLHRTDYSTESDFYTMKSSMLHQFGVEIMDSHARIGDYKLKKINMGQIVINGHSYSGNNISVINNKVIIDGVDQTPNGKEITITIDGNVDQLSVDYCQQLKISGNVNTARTGSGDINCTDITGGASTGSGDISCDTINGNVSTGSGDVEATTITGSVKTGSGDIKHKY
jgi:hypothetical protein